MLLALLIDAAGSSTAGLDRPHTGERERALAVEERASVPAERFDQPDTIARTEEFGIQQ